jgi:hypothetical protein
MIKFLAFSKNINFVVVRQKKVTIACNDYDYKTKDKTTKMKIKTRVVYRLFLLIKTKLMSIILRCVF